VTSRGILKGGNIPFGFNLCFLVLFQISYLCYVFALCYLSMLGMKDCKEELVRLRTMIESMNKSSRLYTKSMKGKSTFNIVGPVY